MLPVFTRFWTSESLEFGEPTEGFSQNVAVKFRSLSYEICSLTSSLMITEFFIVNKNKHYISLI